jgi:pyruvate dehydrogenase E1 component alpha subunit
MVHAVGLAWGSRLLGEPRIAITYFGDGATSEGDFHEAMNFAAVYDVGCIFFCQNNGWAISLPRDQQTKAETIAQKAIAYGMPGIQVDGNDLFAVYQATRDAVDRARRGLGPTLIEAVTYRMGPHTTADDPSRYRSAEEAEDWAKRDPLDRVRIFLAEHEPWDPSWQETVSSEATAEVEKAVVAAESLAPAGAGEIFSYMYAELPPHLRRQQEEAMNR